MWLYFSCWWMISDQTCVITSFLSWAWWKDPLSCLNDEYEATSTSKARLTQQEYLKTTAVIHTQCPATVSTWSGSGKDGLALKTHFLNPATRATHPPAGRASSWLWLSDTYVLRLLHAFIANWWYHTFIHTFTFYAWTAVQLTWILGYVMKQDTWKIAVAIYTRCAGRFQFSSADSLGPISSFWSTLLVWNQTKHPKKNRTRYRLQLLSTENQKTQELFSFLWGTYRQHLVKQSQIFLN